jgi:hypothetical protein
MQVCSITPWSVQAMTSPHWAQTVHVPGEVAANVTGMQQLSIHTCLSQMNDASIHTCPSISNL